MPLLIDRLQSSFSQTRPPKLSGDQDFGWLGVKVREPRVPAAVLVPVIQATEPRLLLTTRTAHLRNHAGQVAFPGGRIDDTDTGPVEAALREANEEVGLSSEHVRILGLSDIYQTGTGYDIQPVVGLLPEGLDLVPNPSEVADIFEVPLEFALDPRNHQLKEAMWQGQLRRYYSIEWQNRTIWGATAGMLVNLAARLG